MNEEINLFSGGSTFYRSYITCDIGKCPQAIEPYSINTIQIRPEHLGMKVV